MPTFTRLASLCWLYANGSTHRTAVYAIRTYGGVAGGTGDRSPYADQECARHAAPQKIRGGFFETVILAIAVAVAVAAGANPQLTADAPVPPLSLSTAPAPPRR